ncbi:P-loop containing nucleoside triphosphate hydrolase protein [Lentinula detonsa]|uniref:P-loop containing nucleoside triphosphate hydrolase protein n=1 Tax=Lentinula detonsa TaxID=2804962 RepID=A0AA38Q4B5_9AGAR|nr:P-loop containing nucleoside triphosphate hydrolase protein [Lentinula detonsa]
MTPIAQTVDGKNILNISRRRLQKNATIRENLDITGLRSDNKVWVAIESSQIESAISKLDGGLNHHIQSISPNLSPGQIQLLALARSLLSGKKTILLDEATAALDGENRR